MLDQMDDPELMEFATGGGHTLLVSAAYHGHAGTFLAWVGG